MEGKGHEARQQRRELRPSSRNRSGEGCAHRSSKRNRVLKHLAKAGVLLQSGNVLPFRLAVHREVCRTPRAASLVSPQYSKAKSLAVAISSLKWYRSCCPYNLFSCYPRTHTTGEISSACRTRRRHPGKAYLRAIWDRSCPLVVAADQHLDSAVNRQFPVAVCARLYL